MLFLPKVKKDDPCLKATKKVKSLVASLLAAVAVAVSGAAYAGPTSMHDSGMSTEIMQVDQSSPLLVIQHDSQQNGSAYHSSHYSHSSHRSHYSHYSSRW